MVTAFLPALVPLFFSGVHVTFGHRRDLGGVVLASSGCVLLVTPALAPVIWSAIALTIIGWYRGAKHGVMRPTLLGFGALLLAFGATAPAFLDTWLAIPVMGLLVPMVGLTGLLALLALERPRASARPIRWYGRVPIDTSSPSTAEIEP